MTAATSTRNAHQHDARRLSAAWRREHRLDRVAGWRLDELAAGCFPTACAGGLVTAVNVVTVLAAAAATASTATMDGYGRAAAVARELAQVGRRPPGAPLELTLPITRGWSALWEQAAAETPAEWRGRAAEHVEQWARAQARLALVGVRNRVDDVAAHLELARDASGARFLLDVDEWIGGYRLTIDAARHRRMRWLRARVVDAVALAGEHAAVTTRDVCRDRAFVVRALTRNEGMTARQAADTVGQLAESAAIAVMRAPVDALVDELALDDDDRAAVGAATGACRAFVTGVRAWLDLPVIT